MARSRASVRVLRVGALRTLRAALAGVFALMALCLGDGAQGCCGGARPAGRDYSIQIAGDRGLALVAEASHWVGAGKFTSLPGPWCADAVSFWLRAIGQPPLMNRLAASALFYGPRLSAPRIGALAVMATRRGRYGHVGVVEGIEPDGSIDLISGNWRRHVSRAVVPRRAFAAFVEVR